MAENKKEYKLKRRKHTPGAAVQRFGDWRKAEPHVMIVNHQWTNLGKPESVTVMINHG
jgi:hypothetical protein